MNGYLREIHQNVAMRKAIDEALAVFSRGASPAIAESILRRAITELDAEAATRRKQASDRVTDLFKTGATTP